jgi:hypothetical protein
VDNTAAIISIQAEELTKTKVLNASQTIQGKAAGVQVISSDFGVAHRQLLLEVWNGLRGRTPLFIVDGMPLHRISTISIRMILHPMKY